MESVDSSEGFKEFCSSSEANIVGISGLFQRHAQSEETCSESSQPIKQGDPANDADDKDCTDLEEELDFGNPQKIIVTILLMPFMVFTINAACNKESCTVLSLPQYPSWMELCDMTCVKLYIGWLMYHVILYYIMPGHLMLGQTTPAGRRLVYSCNGFRVLLLTLTLYTIAIFAGVDVTSLYDRFYPYMATATLTALFLSLYLYWRACNNSQMEGSICGNTGFALYDFYLGKELNPRLGYLDLKYLCELRPGLMGWLLLDLVYVTKALQEQEELPVALLLVALCHGIYVVDALYFEEAVLTTMDITREGFGFMLAFGDLVWVPFLFSLQARFLLEHPQNWRTSCLLIIFGINGYWIFRAANNEKDNFRRCPNQQTFRVAQSLSASEGKTLLVSGWWGRCRHPNYLGDMIMSVAWASFCGFGNVLPWFYPLYLCGTLVHRCGRDDKWCRKKYGDVWEQYCTLVPYRIIPGIY